MNFKQAASILRTEWLRAAQAFQDDAQMLYNLAGLGIVLFGLVLGSASIPQAEGPYYGIAAVATLTGHIMLLLFYFWGPVLHGAHPRGFMIPVYAASGTLILVGGGHLIAAYGLAIEATVREAPYRSAFVAGLLAVWFHLFNKHALRPLLPSGSSHASTSRLQGEYAIGASAQPPHRDRRRTTWHEAGHLLTAAALRGPHAWTSIVAWVDAGGGGATKLPGFGHGDLTVDELEWRLLMLRAGRVAESYSGELGEAPRHLLDDHSWERSARHYLKGGAYGYFYAQPQTALEEASNRRAFEAFAHDQDALLKRFFAANYSSLEETAQVLDLNGRVAPEQINGLLGDLVVPADMPRPWVGDTDGEAATTVSMRP